MLSVKLQLLACTILSSYLMQSYTLHNNGYFNFFFWHIFPYLEHMQLQGIISNQPKYSIWLPDYLPLKMIYVKKYFTLNALPFFPFSTLNILYYMGAAYACCFNISTATRSKMKFIYHHAAPDRVILHNDILNHIKSKHTAVTVRRCKKHTQTHKTRK